MNFFEQQERAKRNTGKLVLLMCLAVIGLVAIASVAVAAILALLGERDPNAPATTAPAMAGDWLTRMTALLDWQLVGTISVLVVGVVIAGSLFKHLQLRSGGKAVAESLNAKPIDPGTTDLAEKKVLNVVEEMAIASGIPVPPVYVMEDESINAFAAGHTPQDAVIGVTRGCIRLLSRDELQGVVAHEFSHIFHGDMRLNTKLVATLNGILLIGLVGYILLRSAPFRRGSSRDNSAFIMLAIGVILTIVGFAGTFFGKLIKSAVSRQREFLADASAVQFTRNPAGIADALKKIGGYKPGSQIRDANAAEYSHMFFSQAVGGALSRFMATHPPLEQRIRRVQPDWDGNFSVPQPERAIEPAADDRRERGTRGVLLATAMGAIDSIGQPSDRHVAYARQTIEALDTELREAAHDIYSARALVYGLLLDPSDSIRSRQLAALERYAEPDAYQYVLKLEDKITALDRRSRLPLISLALPALKQLSSAQYIAFKRCLDELIVADQHISLMEWALYRIVVHNIEPLPSGPGSAALADMRDACQVLLSAIVYAGHKDDRDAHAAFSSAAAGLPFEALELLPRDAVRTSALETAVIKLCSLAPSEKRALMQALARAVEHDGIVSVAQAELLRAIGDSLDCPLPPLLGDT